MLVAPDGGDGLGRHANTDATADGLPISDALKLELVEDRVDCVDEMVQLFSVVSGSRSDSETFFANSDGRVVDGLNVDAVFGEQGVGSGLGESGITNEDRNDVRRARART